MSTRPRSRWRTPATPTTSSTSSIARTGCWVGLDRYGIDIYLPTPNRNATTLALLERGYADRMFISQDYCSSIDWFPPEVQEYLKANEVPDWSMTFLFDSVIPELKEPA